MADCIAVHLHAGDTTLHAPVGSARFAVDLVGGPGGGGPGGGGPGGGGGQGGGVAPSDRSSTQASCEEDDAARGLDGAEQSKVRLQGASPGGRMGSVTYVPANDNEGPCTREIDRVMPLSWCGVQCGTVRWPLQSAWVTVRLRRTERRGRHRRGELAEAAAEAAAAVRRRRKKAAAVAPSERRQAQLLRALKDRLQIRTGSTLSVSSERSSGGRSGVEGGGSKSRGASSAAGGGATSEDVNVRPCRRTRPAERGGRGGGGTAATAAQQAGCAVASGQGNHGGEGGEGA